MEIRLQKRYNSENNGKAETMKRSEQILNYAIPAASAAAVIAGSVLCSRAEQGTRPFFMLGTLLLLLALAILFMLHTLRRSLRITLYAYGNIGLIAGILFTSVLFLVLAKLFAESLVSGNLSLSFLFRRLLGFPREFSYYAVFVIVLICILLGISNVALIRHEGFCLQNALSLLVAGLYIGGTIAIYVGSDLLERYVFTGHDRLLLTLNTVIPLFLLILLCYLECILAGSAILGWRAARQIPKHDKDFVIILGCSIDKRGGLLPLLKGRVNRAVRFAWEQEIETGKAVHYVPSGGKGPNEIMSEGSAMELYLLTRGAEEYEVFPEKKSRNTWENLCFSKKIIDELKPDAKVAFATTNYHILRSGILARRAGLDAEGVAGDTKWYFWPNGFVREFFGILALNGKAHIAVAIAAALLCAALGCLGYFGNLI